MPDCEINVRVAAEPFDAEVEARAFADRHRAAGAIATFVGRVREESGHVTQLVLEHYAGFTDREILKIAYLAAERWPLRGATIVHRVGALNPAEEIVYVAAAADHRRDAIDAVDFLMDFLKSEAPIWKKEIRVDHERWIEPRAKDLIDKQRWRENG